MSTYESQDLECPYCGKFEEASPDCHEPNQIFQHECRHCEKNYTFTIEYSPNYYTSEAACLNGGEHDWNDHLRFDDLKKPETWHLRNYFDVLRTCNACGKDDRKGRNKEGKGDE